MKQWFQKCFHILIRQFKSIMYTVCYIFEFNYRLFFFTFSQNFIFFTIYCRTVPLNYWRNFFLLSLIMATYQKKEKYYSGHSFIKKSTLLQSYILSKQFLQPPPRQIACSIFEILNKWSPDNTKSTLVIRQKP